MVVQRTMFQTIIHEVSAPTKEIVWHNTLCKSTCLKNV